MGHSIRLRLLGAFEAEWNGETIRDFGARKTASLLGYLAFHAGRSISREEIAGVFWPDSEPEASLTSLRSALYNLNKLFPGVAVLRVNRTSISMDDSIVAVDAQQMESIYEKANHANTEELELTLLAEAADLYQGPLLNGFFDEWILPERMRLEEMAGDALFRLALANEQKGEYDEALRYLRRATAINPLDEAARCAIMRSYARSGNRAQAVKEFEYLTSILRDQIGLEPSPATIDLSQRVLAGEFDPAENADQPIDALSEALNWYLKSNPDQAVATMLEMSEFWSVNRNTFEGLEMVRRVLEVPGQSASSRGKLLHLAAFLSYQLSDYKEAERLYSEALEILRTLDDDRELLKALINFAFNQRESGKDSSAKALIQEASLVSERVVDPAALLQFKANTAGMLCQFNELEAGIAMYTEALELSRLHNKTRTTASCLTNLSYFMDAPGEEEIALAYAEEAFQMSKLAGAEGPIGYARLSMGKCLLRLNRIVEARTHLESGVRLAKSKSFHRLAVLLFEAFVELLSREGDGLRAAALLVAAGEVRKAIGAHRSEFETAKHACMEKELKESLGANNFASTSKNGMAASCESLIFA